MKSLLLIALLVVLAPEFAIAQGGAPAPRAEPKHVESPRDVTLATLADEDALRALQAPGRVIFEDDFEQADCLDRYFEVRGRAEGHALLDSAEGIAHRGKTAVRFTAPANGGKESGAGASAWLGSRGFERLYFRRYIRFAPEYDQGDLNHTGGGLTGVATNGKWDQMGKAGLLPTGADRFSCRFEPWRAYGKNAAPGAMFLYTYWMDMQRDRDGNYWGNMLEPSPERRIVPERGKWICLEQMIQVNTVDAGNAADLGASGNPADGEEADEAAAAHFDGEVAAWIDGELYLHMQGIRWRKDAALVLKRFEIGVYVHRAEQDNTVWYDDVVVSTGYIGPLD